MADFTVLYDACVLYPAPLRDLLMHLALTNLFRAKWTNEIHEEWIRNVLSDRPDLRREDLDRTRDLMNLNALDCLVENYEPLISTLTLPDPKDRHVLAAAIQTHADVIVTFNLRDFPDAILEPYGIDAQHPDVFISQWIEIAPALVCNAVKQHRQRLRKPPKTIEEYLNTLQRQGLPQTVSLLQEFSLLL